MPPVQKLEVKKPKKQGQALTNRAQRLQLESIGYTLPSVKETMAEESEKKRKGKKKGAPAGSLDETLSGVDAELRKKYPKTPSTGGR